MLTIEMLRQNSVLAQLTDEQLNAVADMSRNDENAVIATRIGELHGQYDRDIYGIAGIAKNDGEKSYDYAKRILSQYKTAIEDNKKVIADLNKRIEKGDVDDAIKQQLKDAKAQVTQLQAQLTAKEEAFTKEKQDYEAKLKNTHIDYAFTSATSGLKFKDSIPESLKPILLSAAKAEVLSKGAPDFVDDGKGGKMFVLRGADGNIINNVKNNLNPYTMNELLMETSLKDAIDTGRVVTGGGTNNPKPNNHSTGLIDLSGAKTQVEADRMIENYLLSQGITRDSAEFSEQTMSLRADNNVAELPIR